MSFIQIADIRAALDYIKANAGHVKQVYFAGISGDLAISDPDDTGHYELCLERYYIDSDTIIEAFRTIDPGELIGMFYRGHKV